MQTVQYKVCPRCQSQSNLAAQFCERCGHTYRTQFSESNQTRMVVGPPIYQVPPAEEKSKIAAALFAFFLGPLGVHGFYMGNPQMGVTILAISLISGFLWIIGVGFLGTFAISVITLIQAILYIAASDAEFQRKYVFGKQWF